MGAGRQARRVRGTHWGGKERHPHRQRGRHRRGAARGPDGNESSAAAASASAWPGRPTEPRIAFVSATPGPEPPMEADPIVITRYWYRPASGHGGRFNDNRRLHLFVADVATKQVRQLTEGTTYEHSIDWSPDGKLLLFLSNHEPDPDFFFNYDLFTVDVELEGREAADRNEEQRVRPYVVTGRQGDRLLGPQASDHILRDEHGGHARLDARRRHGRQARAGRRHRQPAGTPAVVAGRSDRCTSPCSRGAVPGCIACLSAAARPSASARRSRRAAPWARSPSERTTLSSPR